MLRFKRNYYKFDQSQKFQVFPNGRSCSFGQYKQVCPCEKYIAAPDASWSSSAHIREVSEGSSQRYSRKIGIKNPFPLIPITWPIAGLYNN